MQLEPIAEPATDRNSKSLPCPKPKPRCRVVPLPHNDLLACVFGSQCRPPALPADRPRPKASRSSLLSGDGLIIRVAHTTSVRPKGASENPLIFWVGALIRAEDGGKGRPLGALQTSLATVASERRKHAVVKTQTRTSNERNRSDWGRKQAGRCGVSVRDQPCQMLGPYFKALACTTSNIFFSFFFFPLCSLRAQVRR